MFRSALVLSLCALFSLCVTDRAWCADATALPVEVAPNDPNIQYIGRFDTRDSAGPRCAWSGSAIVVRLDGTALNAKFKASGDDQFQVVIDGKPTSVLVLKKDQTVYQVAENLSLGTHTIELFKRTEAQFGTVQFLGLQLEKGQKLAAPPERLKRRIEIVGDSISCGYGNEAGKKEDKFTATTENNYLTYGAIAARDLKAEYACIAWSGRKLWPNNTIPEIYGRILPQDGKSTWDFSTWKPDVVLINLGTNDFGGNANPEEKGWTDAYRAFIKTIRTNSPDAQIYLAVGPMMSDFYPPNRKALTTIRGWLTGLVEEANKGGDAKVHMIEFESQKESNGYGADWHPSLKTHAIMSEKLIAELKKELKW